MIAEPDTLNPHRIMVPMYMARCKHCGSPIGTSELEDKMQPWVHVFNQSVQCDA